MTDLNAEDRGLLDMARDGHEPTDADRGRMRARLAAELGVAAGLIATTATVGTSAGATGFASASAGGLANAGSVGLASAGSVGLASAGSVGSASAGSASAGSTSAGLAVGGGAATVSTHATLATLSTAKVIAAVLLSGVGGGGGVAVYHAARSERTEPAARAPFVMAAMSPELMRARRSHTQQAANPPTLATPRQTLATIDVPSDAIDPPPVRPSAAGTISADVPPGKAAPPVPPARSAQSLRRMKASDESRADRAEAQVPANPRPLSEAGRSTTAPSSPWKPPTRSFGQTSLPLGSRGMPASVRIATAPQSPSVLESERRLVGTGVAALHAGDAASALTLFDQHAREYPHGILAEERAAERVAALCALSREAEARAAGAAFLRDHGRSPLSARVRGLCGVRSNP